MKRFFIPIFIGLFIFITILVPVNLQAKDIENNKRIREKEGDSTLPYPMPKMRMIEFMKERQFPFDDVPVNGRKNAINQTKSLSKKAKMSQLQSNPPAWKSIGPGNIGGRVKAIAVDPRSSSTIYIGAAAGGIWKTIDRGTTWTPIFDFENAIAFGCIALDPNNPDIIYAGTGEAVIGGSAPLYFGSGLFKSTDAGATWKSTSLSYVGSFSKLYIHPKNSNLIFAGVVERFPGFYKSTDAGETWKKTLSVAVTDVTIDPKNENELMIGVNGDGIYRSTDAGETWNKKSFSYTSNVGRISVQMAPSNPNTVYALSEISNEGRVFKSLNRGDSWTEIFYGGSGFFNDQGFYDNYIAVNPQDPNNVYAGGIDVWRTTNGYSFVNITNGYEIGATVHVDQQCAAFDPSNKRVVYFGNDGGIYSTLDLGDNFQNLNNNLAITQFYALDIDLTQKNKNYGGTQDNGTVGNNSSTQWEDVAGGDGFTVLVVPSNPNIIIGEYYSGNLWRANYSSGEFKSIVNSLFYAEQGLWHSPIHLDPVYEYLYHGRKNLYFSANLGDSWTALTEDNTTQISTITTSPVGDGLIWYGTSSGDVLVCEYTSAPFVNVSENKLVKRFITDIKTDYSDINTAYVALSGYGSSHIFKTTNLGGSWADISSSLPDVPCNAIAIHPDNPNRLFVATDAGVFSTNDGGDNWFPFGIGLPNSPVLDIKFHTNRLVLPQLTLRAATHGRSMWEIEVPDIYEPAAAILSPLGGDNYVCSSPVRISWTGFVAPLKIEYSLDDGAYWRIIKDGVAGNAMIWMCPNNVSYQCRIKITSTTGQVVISNSFSLIAADKGSVLSQYAVSYIPYGIAFDGKDGLWTTNLHGNKLYKLNCDDFRLIKEFQIEGDSLFTDLTMDRQQGIFYIHRMNTTEGNGAKILVYDTLGNKIRSFASQALKYPIGLELVDGNLIAGERDGDMKFYTMNPTNGALISKASNPYQKRYGPRSLCYDGSRYLYQACTYFPTEGQPLSQALIIKIDKNNLSVEVDSLSVEEGGSPINCRGVEIDPRSGHYWVSDYGGNLYKIASYNIVPEPVIVKNDPTLSPEINVEIYPNPAGTTFHVNYNLTKPVSSVEVRIVDVLGRIVGTLIDKKIISEFSNNLEIKADNLSDGVYSIVIATDGKVQLVRKLVVKK